MIERIGQRAGDFVGTTATRALKAVETVVPGGRRPPARRSGLSPGRVVVGAAAAAIGLAMSKRRPAPEQTSGKVLDLTDKTRDELYELARNASIAGRSSMTKQELISALSNADGAS